LRAKLGATLGMKYHRRLHQFSPNILANKY
jgi:hypothetical protein